MPADVTRNDELTAAEEAFIQKMEGPAAEDTQEPETEAPAPDDSPVTTPEAKSDAEAPADPPTPEVTAGEDEAEPDPVDTPEEPEEEADADAIDEAFNAAMAAERAPLTLDGIPEEARPLVQKKMKDLEAGFTRTMQKVRQAEREAAQAKAEYRFQQERPDDFIVSLLLTQPDLMDRVNKKLDEVTGSETAREAHGVVVERAREKAKAAEEAALAEQEAQYQRAVEVTRMAKAASKAYGVPFEMGVEAEVAAHIKIHGDITEAEVKAIAESKAKVWKAKVREMERTGRQQYVQGKVQDRKRAGLAVKPSSGVTPTPGAKPVPTNDDEFIAQFVASGG